LYFVVRAQSALIEFRIRLVPGRCRIPTCSKAILFKQLELILIFFWIKVLCGLLAAANLLPVFQFPMRNLIGPGFAISSQQVVSHACKLTIGELMLPNADEMGILSIGIREESVSELLVWFEPCLRVKVAPQPLLAKAIPAVPRINRISKNRELAEGFLLEEVILAGHPDRAALVWLWRVDLTRHQLGEVAGHLVGGRGNVGLLRPCPASKSAHDSRPATGTDENLQTRHVRSPLAYHIRTDAAARSVSALPPGSVSTAPRAAQVSRTLVCNSCRTARLPMVRPAARWRRDSLR